MKKILLVDDADLIVYSLTKMFRHEGAAVTTVRKGQDALHELRLGVFDICMLDVQLPDADGLLLMPVIRTLSPATAVVIMTANSLNDEQLESIHRHGCHYLPKPFEIAQARELITNIAPPGGTGG